MGEYGIVLFFFALVDQFLYILVWVPDSCRDFAPPHQDYTRSSLRSLCVLVSSLISHRPEGRVTGLDYALRHNGFADIYIFWLSRVQFGALHASTSSEDVKPVPMTSLVCIIMWRPGLTVPSYIPHLMKFLQTRTSTNGSLWHPSRRYVLHFRYLRFFIPN